MIGLGMDSWTSLASTLAHDSFIHTLDSPTWRMDTRVTTP